MRIIPFRSPSISSNILPKASSVWVRVGKSLLRYSSSMLLHTPAMSPASLHLMKISPALPDNPVSGVAVDVRRERPVATRFKASSK